MRILVPLLLVAIWVAACSAGAAALGPGSPGVASRTTTATAGAGTSPAEQSTPASAPAAASTYPLSLADDEGTRLVLAARPQRVVSLTPAVTETVFALGDGGRLVGRTSSDDYPPAAKSIPAVATYNGVDIEKVVALRPDLVVAGGNGLTSAKDIAAMRAVGLPVMVVDPRSIDGVLANIRLVGRALGSESAANALADSIAARVTQVRTAAAAATTHPRTFYEVDATKEIFGPARDSFLAQMIGLAGGEPVTSGDPSVWSISLERLVSADPQVIVLGDANYGTKPADVGARPGWDSITAVRDGAIRPIDDTIVTRPGPRIAEGLAALALAIHPDLVLPPAPSAAPSAP